MKLPSCSKTPPDCKTLAAILKSLTISAVRYCDWKDSDHDDPFGAGGRAVQGYTCDDNRKDKKQHCKCRPGEKLDKLSSSHFNWQEDRVWSLSCAKIEPEFIVEDTRDWITETGYNSWNGYQWWHGVAENAFMVGMSSYHSNWYEDRKYHIMWTKSKDWVLLDCTGHFELNEYDQDINYQLGRDEVIAAISSSHHNWYQDRKFAITVCRLEKKCGEMVSMTWDYDGAREVVDRVVYAGMSQFDNLKGTAQNSFTTKLDAKLSETFVNSYSFERTEGHETMSSLPVEGGMSWGVGTKGNLELTKGFSETWKTSKTWTRSNSKNATDDNGQEISFTSNCPPGCLCKLNIQLDMARASIPYTLTSRTKGTTDTADYCVEKGIMKGVKTWNVRAISDDSCLDPCT